MVLPPGTTEAVGPTVVVVVDVVLEGLGITMIEIVWPTGSAVDVELTKPILVIFATETVVAEV